MTIGLIGEFVVLVIGLAVGGASGYYGGAVDDVLQHLCEMVMLLPGLLPAADAPVHVPAQHGLDQGLLRRHPDHVPGRLGRVRPRDPRHGALDPQRGFRPGRAGHGTGRPAFIARHILPNTMGYVVVATTLRIPGFILGESALSVLGLGIMEPTPSWGNMLQKAMDILELDQHPWVLWPGVFIFLAIMAFNLVGDGRCATRGPAQGRGLHGSEAQDKWHQPAPRNQTI